MHASRTFAAALAIAASAARADYFTEDAAPFDALIGAAAQHHDFSGPYVHSGDTWNWGNVSFTCHEVQWCSSFGGYIDHFNFVEGDYVYYAPPDSATFTFSQPIIALGMDVYGIGMGQSAPFGSPQPTPMQLSSASGEHEFFSNYVGNYNISVPVFAGILFDHPVTSITVHGSWEGNGMFFTDLRYVTAPVPEPASYAMLLGGLVTLAMMRRMLKSISTVA